MDVIRYSSSDYDFPAMPPLGYGDQGIGSYRMKSATNYLLTRRYQYPWQAGFLANNVTFRVVSVGALVTPAEVTHQASI